LVEHKKSHYVNLSAKALASDALAGEGFGGILLALAGDAENLRRWMLRTFAEVRQA